MTGILQITRLVCESAEARGKVLEALQHAAIDAASQDGEIEQYLVTTPLEDTSGVDIYVIEEFTSQSALECHQAAQTVDALRNMLSAPPETHSNPIAIKTTSGPPLLLTTSPAVLLVGIEYKPGTSSNAVTGWEKMAEGAVKSVPGVNVFTVAKDAEANIVRTVEVLDSWDSLNVLVKTDAAKNNIEHNGKDRTGVKSAIRLRAVAGFVGR
ncbi:uncharacterized protein M421DRAFT_172550 [Didymella exigua CBS 183.55]|uniref:ABM domain-containing protein n=1 Tax=Didymella exigua CBS 183.55 TaxID=1150837 RepID=A0A6A5RH79_9PLEO|nr:uncharacterized protein M421DRAFT_172550 [Didymella exigua CBS 183.55]KAF1927675.1 hypothetical protein M421DRAFT_172550 [Didymella exigua CBS 183.55]